MRLWRLLSTLRLRLRSVFRRARVEQELDDEIRDHIDRRVAEDVARGVPREQARQAAMRAFGGIEQAKEACRDARRVNVIEHTVQDLRFAARHLARAPVVTATMIGIFALGIGFSTALLLFIRSFVNGPLPGVPRQESLVRIRGIDRTQPGRAIGREFSYPEYREYAAQRTLFSAVAAWTSSDIVFDAGTPEANPQSGAATYVTGNYFQVLGLRPDTRRGPPAGGERRRRRAAARRRDQPRAVGETLRSRGGRERPRDESERRHGHDRRRRAAPIRRRADGRVADARLAAAQHTSAGPAHSVGAHQL